MIKLRFFAPVVAAVLLASCGGNQAPIGAPVSSSYRTATARRATTSIDYHVIYSFSGEKTAPRHPEAGLVSHGTMLYGTTNFGGSHTCEEGCGTVYALTPTGTLTTIHRFVNGTTDGQYPLSAVTYMGKTLYGTTALGGSGTNCGAGCGTVFSINSAGDETLLHSFDGGSSDGATPKEPLISVNGTLYGVTLSGGADNDGTVFSISASGTETVLHSFTGGSSDGAHPMSPLVNIKGVLYGATESGGASDDGTVFSITPSGTETVLYSFKGGTSDGSLPDRLVDRDGVLYGTTAAGGLAKCFEGCGVFFQLTLTGSETVVHSFLKTEALGNKSIVKAGGIFYGTAAYGGAFGRGTLFSITPKGVTTVLHSFGGSYSDGKVPVGELLVVNGTIYGATLHGSGANKGTIYTLSQKPNQ